LLRLRSENAVSDNEVQLYSSLLSGFGLLAFQGSNEFWTMLETQLQNAIEKAKKPAS